MRRIIHHIRKQPEHIKRHILHVTLIICGVMLVLLWIYSLGTNLTNDDMQAKVNQELKPLSVLKANLIGGYNSITQPNSDTQQ